MKRIITATLLALSLTLTACQGGELPVEFTPTCQQTPVGEICPKGTSPSTTTPETAP